MQKLCQRNPSWADVKIGDTNMTLARWGCLITDLSMLTDYFGDYISPNRIATDKKLVMFNNNAQVIWESLCLPSMAFDRRIKYRDDEAILDSLKNPNKAVIIEVDGSHWLTGMYKIPLLNKYICADPWTGGTTVIINSSYKVISGSAHFIRKV